MISVSGDEVQQDCGSIQLWWGNAKKVFVKSWKKKKIRCFPFPLPFLPSLHQTWRPDCQPHILSVNYLQYCGRSASKVKLDQISLYFSVQIHFPLISGKEWAPSSWATRGSLALSEGKECRKGGRCQYLIAIVSIFECWSSLIAMLSKFEFWTFSISMFFISVSGDVMCLHQLENHEPVEFGEIGIDPVERDQVRWHHSSIPRIFE